MGWWGAPRCRVWEGVGGDAEAGRGEGAMMARAREGSWAHEGDPAGGRMARSSEVAVRITSSNFRPGALIPRIRVESGQASVKKRAFLRCDGDVLFGEGLPQRLNQLEPIAWTELQGLREQVCVHIVSTPGGTGSSHRAPDSSFGSVSAHEFTSGGRAWARGRSCRGRVASRRGARGASRPSPAWPCRGSFPRSRRRCAGSR